MFEPFPGKYVWNLSTGIALATGGLIGEVDRACRPLLGLETDDEDEATQAFFLSWCALADGLAELAEADEKHGRHRSAGYKYGRAAVYYQTAERMQARTYQPRQDAYRKALGSFARYLELTAQPAERVEIPCGTASLPGILVLPDHPKPAPCVLFFNGLDSTKEQIYGTGTAAELRRRGIATLIVDTPGAGEALRLRGLTATPETEHWATACIDYLTARDDTDENMVGMLAWSLGGYYGPRATAFEPRIRFGVAWGANYDWGQVQVQRLRNQGSPAGTPLLGARPVGVGLPQHRGVPRPRTRDHAAGNPRPDHRALPRGPRRARPADPGPLCPRPLQRPGQQPETRTQGIHRARRRRRALQHRQPARRT